MLLLSPRIDALACECSHSNPARHRSSVAQPANASLSATVALKPDFVASWSVVVLHGLLTSVTAFEDFFAVLYGLLATMLLCLHVDVCVRWMICVNRCCGAG
jgi:hypothetical protein